MARLISYDYIRQKALADPDSGEAVVYLQDIAEAPTVDAVEVVRCKDCIYYHRKIGYGFGQCSKCRLMPYHDDFCSYGERKDGDWNG